MTFNNGKYTSNPQPYTEARRKAIEKLYQENRDEIKADLEGLEQSIHELEKKWGVHNRSIRRWMERLGIDPNERTLARRRGGYEKKPPKQVAKPKVEDKPQAHKLVGLW